MTNYIALLPLRGTVVRTLHETECVFYSMSADRAFYSELGVLSDLQIPAVAYPTAVRAGNGECDTG